MSMVFLPVSKILPMPLTLVAAAPDAIQLTVGEARLLQSLCQGAHKPSLVLRTDVANVYVKESSARTFQPHDRGTRSNRHFGWMPRVSW
jgi:hypothetical protein